MNARRQVALLVETSNAYARGLIEGVSAYVRDHQSWSMFLPETGRGDAPSAALARWKGDGVIARIETAEMAKAVRRLRVPAIDLSAARFLPDLPWIETDDDAIARLALDHFAERGFRHVAFCGDPRFNWSKWRCDRFLDLAHQAGLTASAYGASGSLAVSWQAEHAKLVRWVQHLPRPIGIFACYDIRAFQLLDACRDAGISVPEEAAVLGVDNDPVLCELCDPPLSSVMPDARRAGYLAAEMLDRWISGKPPAAEAHRIAPIGIRTRQSTDVLAMEDRDVAAAVRFIRERACTGISVNSVLREVPLSRRVLERRFFKCVGRSPHAEILRVKLVRVMQLLVETDMSIESIATMTGFEHPEYLSVAFKREIGIAPAAYRRDNRIRTTGA
ncbi:MAG: DNA-binding transcriptional regulator [Gemmataceae bacterium]